MEANAGTKKMTDLYSLTMTEDELAVMSAYVAIGIGIGMDSLETVAKGVMIVQTNSELFLENTKTLSKKVAALVGSAHDQTLAKFGLSICDCPDCLRRREQMS